MISLCIGHSVVVASCTVQKLTKVYILLVLLGTLLLTEIV